MVFSSKADHVCNDKGLNMLTQAFGRGCDPLLPACCVVNNVRLLPNGLVERMCLCTRDSP
jgi:hypothetical protein